MTARRKKRPGPENRLLALPVPPKPRRDPTPVTVQLSYVRETKDAWLLRRGSLAAGWAPKSEVTRGEGDRENFWTMPRWVAAERGWV